MTTSTTHDSLTVTGTGVDLVPRAVHNLRTLSSSGSLLGAQLTVERHGEVVADIGVGRCAPDRPARPDDVVRLYCIVKPVIAACVLRAQQDGLLSVEDPLWHHVDCLRNERRDAITVADLLSHSSGIPHLCVKPYRVGFDETVRRAGHTPVSPAGWWDKPGYNMSDAWHLLAAVLQNVHNRPIADIVRREIAETLGRPDLRLLEPDAARFAPLQRPAKGAPTTTGWEPIDEPIDVVAHQANPAFGGFASGRDVTAFYNDLLAGLQGRGRLLDQASVEAMTTPRREVNVFTGPLRPWGLGMNIDVAQTSLDGGWGKDAFGHPSSFGHFGSGYAFADPGTHTTVFIRVHSVGPRSSWALYSTAGQLWQDLQNAPAAVTTSTVPATS